MQNIIRYSLFIIFYALVGAALLSPIASNTFLPNLADYVNHLAAIIQAKTALAEGQFPLRIAPFEESGWRYAYFQFYSPTAYTIAALIYKFLTPDNPLVAYKFTIWASLICGGIYMYRLSYWFCKSTEAALLASIVYLFAPYYIIVIDRLGDLTESLSLGVLPAVLYYTFKHYETSKNNYTSLLKMSLAWYLLATIHLVNFIYSTATITLFLFILTLQNKQWKNFLRVLIGYSFSYLLALWFLAPVALWGKYLRISGSFNESYDFHMLSPLLSYLLSPTANVLEGDFRSLVFKIHPALGLPIIIAAGAAFYAFIHKQKIFRARADAFLPALLISFIIVFFLVWSPLDIWQWLPKFFSVGQYSWRLLSQLMWIGALLFAWSLCYIFKSQFDRRHTIIGILILLAATGSWLPSFNPAGITLSQILNHPSFVFNTDAYTIDTLKNPNLVNVIDQMPLYSLVSPKATLELNKTYYIPNSLLNLTYSPRVDMTAVIPDKSDITKNQLSVLLNGIVIGKHALNNNAFSWEIPLDHNLFKSNQLFQSFEFKLDGVESNSKLNTDILLQKLVLNGFLNPIATLNVEQVAPHCQQVKTETLCKVNVPKTTTLLELPIIYYPDLMTITLNNTIIPFQSVLIQDRLIAAIKPLPGQMNVIRIKFHGLVWANQMSWLAWILAGIMFMLSLKRK